MKRNVRADDFIRCWQSGKTLQEVALALGMTNTYCRTRANDLRKRGVHLKDYPKGVWTEPLNIDRLNRIAKASLRP